MNRLSMLGKRAGLVTAMLAVLAGLGANHAAASGAPPSAHLFWGGWYDGIGHASPDGSATQRQFIPGPNNWTFVAANERHVYWTSLNGEIGRANVDGSDVRPSLITGLYGAAGIALDKTYVYWIESDFGPASIGRAKLDGSEVNRDFITGVNVTQQGAGLAVDGSHIYWAGGYDSASGTYSAVGRAEIDGENVENRWVRHPFGDGGDVQGVAVDATHVYWTHERADGLGTTDVLRAPLSDPSARQQLVSVPNWIVGVAVDDQHVYFSQYGSGWIGRTELDGENDDVEFIDTNGHEHGGHPTGIALAPAPAPNPTLTVVASPAKPGSTKPEFTTSPNVQLKTTAPAGTTQVEISNDPGFGDAQTFLVAADGTYAWTLPGDGEHTVYVRFLGAGSQPTLNATVKLDATAPTITKARFVKRRNGRVWMTVAAVDSGSGVAQLQFAPKRNHPWPGAAIVVKTSNRTKQPFIWVRIADGAGNVSAWKKILLPAKRGR